MRPHPCVLQGTVHISLFCFVNNDDPTEQDVLFVCMFVSRLRPPVLIHARAGGSTVCVSVDNYNVCVSVDN